MTIRSKVLAVAIGLAMASGAIGGAFAQSGHAVAPKTLTSKTIASKTVASKTVAAPKMTKIAAKHRLHVAHRTLKHKMVAHRITSHAKLARAFHRTHVASHQMRAKLTKIGLIKTHSKRTHVVAARTVKIHLVKKPLVNKHFASRTTKSTVIR